MFKKTIITSGPTLEPIDPVRFISNRSSGKTGYHLATEARNRGIGEIVFISGPTCFLPDGVHIVKVETAREMYDAVNEHFDQCAVTIMAAAVSDYRSAEYHPQKMKKDHDTLILELAKNPDILSELGRRKRPGQILVGFAAESEDIFVNAEKKLVSKNLDLLVLNEISARNPAFGCEENQVYFLRSAGINKIEKTSKAAIAALVWDEIFALFHDPASGQRNR